jgi:hypothetical protein
MYTQQHASGIIEPVVALTRYTALASKRTEATSIKV